MRLLVVLLFFVFLFSENNLTKILNEIPKTSPSYSLAQVLIKKINSLKSYKINFEVENIKNQFDYTNKFLKLVELRVKINNLNNQIEDLEDKINYLSVQKDAISKLQLAYYQKRVKILKDEVSFLENHLKDWEKRLFKIIDKIHFDIKYAQKEMKYWNKLLIDKKREFEQLKIDLQKWKLLNNKQNLEKIKQFIKINQNKQKEIYKNLIKNKLIIYFDDLKKKSKETFKISQEIVNLSKNISSDFYSSIKYVLFDFEKFAFGKKIIFYESKNEVELFFQKLKDFINYPLFNVSNRTITPLDFIILIFVLLIGWIVGKYYKKLIYSLRDKYDLSHSTATLLANMGYYFILIVTFLIALRSVGLNLGSLAIIAGALSVGIGFGLQNIVSNFVSGIILMFEKSIKVGDYIQIDENTRGEVIDISMRSTIIRTNDNINLIIPNQTFIQNNVINWTLGDDIVRFRIPFGVAYGSDIDKVEKVILEALDKSNLPFIRVESYFGSADVKPRVVFLEMGDSSLNFELFVWVKGVYAKRPRRTKSEFLKLIYNTLNENNIEIPFPQNDIHFRNSLEVNIKNDKNL